MTLYVTLQILCEFYSVITNPKRIAVSSSSAEAVQIILDLLDLPGVQILASPVNSVTGLLQLLKRKPVTGGAIFDLQIAATMQANNIQTIYTFNTDDFEVVPELKVITP